MEANSQKPREWNENKDTELYLNYIRKEVVRGTGLQISELLEISHFKLFEIALSHVTTTKKAICEAFQIKTESACRFKRDLEKQGKLIEIYWQTCPVTGYPKVAFLTTNPEIIQQFYNE